MSEGLGHLVVKDYKSSMTIDTGALYKTQISHFKSLQAESLNNFTKNVQNYNNEFSQNGPNEIWKRLNNNLNSLQKDYLYNLDDEKRNELKELLLEIQNYSLLSMILLENKLSEEIQIHSCDWEKSDLLFDSLHKKEDNVDNCVIS
jgi:hypothetical protein